MPKNIDTWKYYLLFLFLPLVLVLLGHFIKGAIADYSLTSIDPEYSYLLNGLNIAHLNFPWHIDHPGTPLQILSGVVIRVAHLFRSGSLDSDVFANPEYYVNAIIYTLIYLQAFIILLVGIVLFRITKNYFLSFFIQLSPFAIYSLMLQNRILVEQMEEIAAILLITAVIWYLYTYESNKPPKLFDKYVVVFAVLIGFGIANKILFAPLFILPFIVLTGIKRKISYSVMSVFFFALFAFPIFKRWVPFRDWVKNLLVHSGQYGSGATNIVDKDTFISNVSTVLHFENMFAIVVALMIITLLVYQLPFIKRKVENKDYYRVLFATTLTTILLVIIVCKQFKYFYLAPVLILIVFDLFIIVSIFTKPFSIFNRKWIAVIALLLFCGLIYRFELRKLHPYRTIEIQNRDPYIASKRLIIEKFNNKPKLLLSAYYGAPYVEYSLYFGTAWCGEKMTHYYSVPLKELYPNSYVYKSWDNEFSTWGYKNFSYFDLLKKHKEVIIYMGNMNFENSLHSKFYGLNRMLDTEYEKVYSNDITNEIIYIVRFDSALNIHNKTFICDAETVDSVSGEFKNAFGQVFEGGFSQSNSYAKSGKYSAQLTPEQPIGMTCYLSEVQKGEQYRVSVWALNNGNKNIELILKTATNSDLFLSQNLPTDKKGEWMKFEITFIVPDGLHNKDLEIYCWNKDSKLPAFFDDLEISIGK